jgi:hypothetical protein
VPPFSRPIRRFGGSILSFPSGPNIFRRNLLPYSSGLMFHFGGICCIVLRANSCFFGGKCFFVFLVIYVFRINILFIFQGQFFCLEGVILHFESPRQGVFCTSMLNSLHVQRNVKDLGDNSI